MFCVKARIKAETNIMQTHVSKPNPLARANLCMDWLQSRMLNKEISLDVYSLFWIKFSFFMESVDGLLQFSCQLIRLSFVEHSSYIVNFT